MIKQWNAGDFPTHDSRLKHAERAHDHWRAATNAYRWLYGEGQFGAYLPYRKLDAIEVARWQRTADQDCRRFGWNSLELKAAVEWLKSEYPGGFSIDWPRREDAKPQRKGSSFAANATPDAWQPAPTIERDYPETFALSDEQRAALLAAAFGTQAKAHAGVRHVAEVIFP